METRTIIIDIIVAVILVALAGAYYQYFYKSPRVRMVDEISTAANVTDLNPVEKTNPFTNIKTNPFE